MNPYALHLGNEDPVQVIASTAAQLASVVASLDPARLNAPWAPGKWSVREILCHLADAEIAFAFRLRQTLAEPHHVIQPYDQKSWAERYPAYDARIALEAFTAVREWNLRLIGSIPPAGFSKPVTHPERGEMTFLVLLETMAGHDLNHLAQLRAVTAVQ